ncbi:MAG: DUF535 domain-containing protein [Bradyrhizobium sp.]|nr:MAG: DUF535 domain-containing protein [Bradyrhizobium sp.]
MTSLPPISFEKLRSASVRVSSAIASPTVSPMAAFRDKALRLFFLRGLLSPFVAARWAGFIRAYHRAFDAEPPVSRVLAKPVRSYVDARLGPARRLDMLRTHYNLLRGAVSPDALRRLCSGEAIQIVELEARKGNRYRLVIAASVAVSMQREGELALYLVKRGARTPVSRISLALGLVQGGAAVMIGGLQGPGAGHKRDVIDATRELHGLRPKDATLLAARALANALGAGSVQAVADRVHVLNRLQDLSKHADYDSYWRERGATSGGPLGFVFPPLAAPAEPGGAREAVKSAIVSGIERFVREHGAVRSGGNPSIAA